MDFSAFSEFYFFQVFWYESSFDTLYTKDINQNVLSRF